MQPADFEHLENQPIGAERRQDVVRDGAYDVLGGGGLGERRGRLTHPDRPLGPGRRTRSRRRAGQTFQARTGPRHHRTQQGPLRLVRLAGPCREYGQHPDRPADAQEGHRRRAGRPDPQGVPTSQAGRPPARRGRAPCPARRADPPTLGRLPGEARPSPSGATARQRSRTGAARRRCRPGTPSPAGAPASASARPACPRRGTTAGAAHRGAPGPPGPGPGSVFTVRPPRSWRPAAVGVR